MQFKIGDKVSRHPINWIPSAFDEWGRGLGIGVVEEPPFDLDGVAVDVRWPSGRCFENLDQLVHAPTELELNVLDSIADTL